MTALRWPLHPRPGPVEALSSWLARTARLYGLTAEDLLRHNLGPASFALAGLGDLDLDWDPPGEVLAALGERTGLGMHELRPMTLAGWVPWLTDTLSLDGGQAVVDTYVRQYSVLLRPGEARQNQVNRWRPWLPARAERQACPACAADPGRGLILMWRVPLMNSCAEHGCKLEPESDVRLAALAGNPVKPEPAAPGTTALDRLTFQALTAGRVSLPGGSAHAGVWFRLLRTMLDELSIAPSALTATSAAIVRSVWAAANAPLRAGLTVWRPYEMLRQPARQAMMHAAGIALQLAGAGEIRPRGVLGCYLRREPHREVYEGDRRAWEWKQAVAEFTAEFDTAASRARSGDADAARKLLTWYTLGCRTPRAFPRHGASSPAWASPSTCCRITKNAETGSPPGKPEGSVTPPLARQVHAAHQVEGASDPEADLAGTRPVIEELQRPGGRHDSRGGADQHGAPDRDPVRAQDKGPGALGQRDLLPSAGHSMPFGVQGGGVDRVGARGEHRLFQGPVPLGVAGQLVALAPPFAAVRSLRAVLAFQAQARGELRGLLWGLAVAGGCGGTGLAGFLGPVPGAGCPEQYEPGHPAAGPDARLQQPVRLRPGLHRSSRQAVGNVVGRVRRQGRGQGAHALQDGLEVERGRRVHAPHRVLAPRAGRAALLVPALGCCLGLPAGAPFRLGNPALDLRAGPCQEPRHLLHVRIGQVGHAQ